MSVGPPQLSSPPPGGTPCVPDEEVVEPPLELTPEEVSPELVCGGIPDVPEVPDVLDVVPLEEDEDDEDELELEELELDELQLPP